MKVTLLFTLKATIVIGGCLLISLRGPAQQLNECSFEQLDSLQAEAPRPVAVFIYTDWCKYCAALKNTSLRNPQVVDLLNEQFYFISLDAESKTDIQLAGRTFSFKPSGNNQGIHELSEQLGTTNGVVAYPTLCFLNADYEIVFQYNQFINATDLAKVLEGLRAPNARPEPEK